MTLALKLLLSVIIPAAYILVSTMVYSKLYSSGQITDKRFGSVWIGVLMSTPIIIMIP